VKKYFWFIIVFIISLIIFYFQINEKYNFFIDKPKLNITLPKKIKKECNTSKMAKNNIWLKRKIKKTKKENNKKINKTVYVQNNSIIINNNKYTYIGTYNKFLIFLTKFNNKTKFIKLNIKDKFPDSNVTLIKNTKREIVFKYKDYNLTIKKPFIDIEKYQKKDNNESKS